MQPGRDMVGIDTKKPKNVPQCGFAPLPEVFREDEEKLIAREALEVVLDLHRVPAHVQIHLALSKCLVDVSMLGLVCNLMKIVGSHSLDRIPENIDQTYIW